MPSLPASVRSSAARGLLLLPLLAFSACSLFRAEPAPTKSWSLWPWKGGKGRDATAYIEYQRARADGAPGMLTVIARNTDPKRTIEGQMRTTMQISPSDLKVDSQSFTLGPNEPKKLITYPARYQLTYEVTATFRD